MAVRGACNHIDAVAQTTRCSQIHRRSPPPHRLPRNLHRRPDATDVVVVVDLPFPAVRAIGASLGRAGPAPACLPRRRRPDAAEPWPRVVVAVVLDGAAAVAGVRPSSSLDVAPGADLRISGSTEGEVDDLCDSLGPLGPDEFAIPSQPGRRCKSHSNPDLLPRMMIRPMQPQRPCSSSTDSVLLFLPPVNNANLWIKETPCYLNPIHDDLFQVRILSANPFPSSLLILLNPIRCVASLSPLQVNY